MNPPTQGLSVVMPTFGRGRVMLETLRAILEQQPDELLLVDQNPAHEATIRLGLERFEASGCLRRVLLKRPSIPVAMNVGLLQARNELVLFLDDDLVPAPGLLAAHVAAHKDATVTAVAGQVLQPGEAAAPPGEVFRFNSDRPGDIFDVMAGNLSVKKAAALGVGGFDENFEGAAYRFETEFAERLLAAGGRIRFEPAASIRHLRSPRGGTRSHGEHWRTWSGAHAVGGYYHILVSRKARFRPWSCALRFLRALSDKRVVMCPWRIPVVAVAEARGFLRALVLKCRGPRHVARQ